MARLKPINYKRVWRETDKRQLAEQWRAGRTVAQLARELDRTPLSVVRLLREMKLRVRQPAACPKPKPTRESHPEAYYEGIAADYLEDCPYPSTTYGHRVSRAWWLAGFHDGQRDYD